MVNRLSPKEDFQVRILVLPPNQKLHLARFLNLCSGPVDISRFFVYHISVS